MLIRGVLFLYDNALPHVTGETQGPIEQCGWEQLNHPPYSPDWTPSDYHLFFHLKRSLAGQPYDDDADVKNAVKQ